MELNNNGQVDKKRSGTLKRALVCALVLFLGLGIMRFLASQKTPPKEAEDTERVYNVEGLTIAFQDYPTEINGFGEARPVTVVELTPEVSGRVVRVHPRLEAGEIIAKGELLFAVDTRDYRIVLESGTRRLDILTRNRDLAEKEFQRVKSLYENNKVGSLSGVDAAEKAYLSVWERVSQLEQTVETARLNLARCTVTMPFDGRITTVSLEKGQFVTPSRPVITLSDDSVLDIEVPVDSREVQQVLKFKPSGSSAKTGWFPDVEKVTCRVRWTENPQGQTWTGTLDRIARYSKDNRTVSLVVRVTGEESRINGDGVPLVDGMFCSVTIPGRTLSKVLKIPRWAVSLEDMVYCSVNNRLKTFPVTVVRTQGNQAFVKGDLPEGEMVVITRMVNPLENILLHVTPAGEKETAL